MYLFTMKAEAAMVFFESVQELEAFYGRKITEEERVIILTEMAKMGYVESVMETNRTKEEILRDSVKNFGDILHLKDDGTAEIIKQKDMEKEDGND